MGTGDPTGRHQVELTMARDKLEYDVIVAGSGVAGLASALAIADAGMSVAVLEKDRLLGGTTALSAGGIWAGCNHLARAAGIADSKRDVFDYVRFVAGGAAEEDMLNAFVETAPVALEYFERCGIQIQLVDGLPDHYFPVAPGAKANGRMMEPAPISVSELGPYAGRIRDSRIDPHRERVEEFVRWGGVVNRKAHDHALLAERESLRIRTCGPALVAHFVKALMARGIPIIPETGMDKLSFETESVRVHASDGRTFSARRGVVLATGGWEGDTQLAGSFEGLPGLCSAGPAAVSGDGFRIGVSAGASTALIRNNLAVVLGFVVPVGEGATTQETEFRLAQVRECACPHNIIVNAGGNRFSDESYFQEAAAAIRQYDVWKREFVNLPCYMIFDSQYVENFAFCGGVPGNAPPDWVQRADTLQQLASQLGIAEAGLSRTVERFNGFVASGIDEDFHRGEKKWRQGNQDAIKAGSTLNRGLGSIAKPPFFGARMFPAPFVPSGGLRVNRHAQVVDGFGKPIQRLYAVGNVAAHLEYGVGYQAGFSLMSAMTFGYLGARHMLQARAS